MTEPTPNNPQPYPQVEGFTITGLIDRGGFSFVYAATQHVLDRSVAIKVLNASFEDQRQRAVFERECRAMGRLSTHQNIVTVVAPVFTADGLPGIVMEQYRGTLRNEGTLPVVAVLDVGAKIADALQAIHDEGITHRDIKPHNIFVSDRDEPAIGDFGISSISDESTVSGGAGFSINYAPPEVFEEGGANQPGDLYSLGATLYHLASGEVPFPHHGPEDDRMRATVQRIIQSPPPVLDVDGAPLELGRLLKRCMAKSPSDRPASAGAIAHDLRKMLNALGGAPSTPSLTPRQPLATSSASAPAPTVEPTIARPGSRSTKPDTAATPSVDAEQQRSESERPRKLVLLLAAAVIVAIGLVGVTLTALGGDDESTPSTIATTIPVQADFEVLTAPTDLEVTSVGDDGVRISWSTDDPTWKVQITEIGSDRSEIVDGSPFEWTSEDGSGCFELRTVNATETRLSQASAGPECA